MEEYLAWIVGIEGKILKGAWQLLDRYYIRDYQWRTYDVSGAGVKKIKKGTTCIGVLSYSEERAPIPFHSP